MSDAVRLELLVVGMTCRRCVREVTALLRDVQGVERVTVDIAASTVQLRGSMTNADVLEAFAGTPYGPVLSQG